LDPPDSGWGLHLVYAALKDAGLPLRRQNPPSAEKALGYLFVASSEAELLSSSRSSPRQ